jgi:hypothetical protein
MTAVSAKGALMGAIDFHIGSKPPKSRARLTYRDQRDKDADKAQQLKLLVALGARECALRLDECECWRIGGNRGHIYTWGDDQSWVMYCRCRSSKAWAFAKRRLAGYAKVTQDGDDEGCLRLDRLPTADEAATIRDLLGIPKRVAISDSQRELLLAHAFARGRVKRGDNRKISAETPSKVPNPPPTLSTEISAVAGKSEAANAGV